MTFIDREFDSRGATVTAGEFLTAVDEAALFTQTSADMMEQGLSFNKVLDLFMKKVNDSRKTSSFSMRLLWVLDTEGRPTLVPEHAHDAVQTLQKLKQQFAAADRLADEAIMSLIEKSIA